MTDGVTNDGAADGMPDDEDSAPLYRRIPWRRIASVLAVVVLIAVVLPFVVYAFPQLVGAEHSYVVLSGSMEPTIGAGDVIIVGNVAASDVETGDIVTFRRPSESRPTTHRVVEVVRSDEGLAFRTAGDNNEDPDPELVEPDQLVGKIVAIGGHLMVIPIVGRIIMFSSTQMGFLLLGVLPLNLFVLNELWNVIASSRPAASETDTEKPSTGSEEEAGSAEETFAFSGDELRVGVAVLFVFFAYSAWVAYATLTAWALGVLAAVGSAFLLGAGLLVFGGRDGRTDESGDDQTDGSADRNGEPSASTPGTTGEPVSESPGDLVERLLEADPTTVRSDADGDRDIAQGSRGQTGDMTRAGGDGDDD